MSLLVRDEADIISDNIRYHAARGVDAFVVMDNGSKDGTREHLAALADEFELRVIDNPANDYRQADWMTRLARIATRQMGADFVINNDADEFWVPDQGCQIGDALWGDDVVVKVPRHNAVFTDAIGDANYDYLDAPALVAAPVQWSRAEQLKTSLLCMQLVPTGPKVIVRGRGLRRVRGGNHGASHWFARRKRDASGLRILHFPIRSLARFRQNIAHRAELLRNGASMGSHYRRWVSQLEQGRLEEEIKTLTMRPEEVDTLCRLGVLNRARPWFSDLRQVLRAPDDHSP